MDAQELRTLQEAYLDVYYELDEGYKPLPVGKMINQSSRRIHNIGRDYNDYFTHRGYVADLDKAHEKNQEMSRVAASHSEKEARAKSKLKKEQADIYDIILSHLLDEGYAETPEAAEVIMVNMSEEWRETILEAEVLAQKGGVPGTVNVNKTKEGGFFGIGSKEVSKPVSGSFKEKDVSSKDAARYNTAVDRKFGSSDNIDSTPAANVQYAANRAGHSGYMKVNNPSSIPDTGIPNRPSPGRSFDQNQARTMSSDIVRMNKQR